MKRNRKILYVVYSLCLIPWIAGCDAFISYTYDCIWKNDKTAAFVNSQLLKPQDDCNGNFRFENSNLDLSLKQWSLVSIMDDIANYKIIGNGFSFKWTVTLVTNKPCDYDQKTTNSITLNVDNYTSYMSFQQVDKLEGTFYIGDTVNFTPNNHKHEMVFQIFNVENTYDNQFGTIIWKHTFDTPVPFDFDEWTFFFPNNGVKGEFNSNSYNGCRMYINGQYIMM